MNNAHPNERMWVEQSIICHANQHTRTINEIVHRTIRPGRTHRGYTRDILKDTSCVVSVTFKDKAAAEQAMQTIIERQKELLFTEKGQDLNVQLWQDYISERVQKAGEPLTDEWQRSQNEEALDKAAIEYWEIWVPQERQWYNSKIDISPTDLCRWRNTQMEEAQSTYPKCHACRKMSHQQIGTAMSLENEENWRSHMMTHYDGKEENNYRG